MSKMPKLSIKLRITLWYAALLAAICIFAMFILVAVSEQAADVYCRDTLLNAATVIIDELDVEEGELEIDDDIDEVPGVYASLFEMDGDLIYGRKRVSEPFGDGLIRETHMDGYSWYIYDQLLEIENRESVWLRLYMAANVSENALYSVLRSGAWLLPLLEVLALLGGYWLTVRAFRPVRQMSELASSIADGNDLSRRVDFGGRGADELHALADTLNAMLGRLEGAFVRESRFASDAAHELRTPLNAMRTQGEYALSREDIGEKDEAIGRMLEKSEEMHALVDHLLMIARMDTGEIALDEVCDLEKIIGRVAEDMEIVAMERDIHIESSLKPCQIMGNRAILTRAVINLVDNAIRYGKEGGCVSISLAKEGGSAVIRVKDDGCGIATQELEHVFERFWRSDKSRATSGTGIGLSIVQSAAHAHSGEASVQSELGVGSCFAMTLPLEQN